MVEGLAGDYGWKRRLEGLDRMDAVGVGGEVEVGGRAGGMEQRRGDELGGRGC
jgi:hypothetical protein